MKPSSIHKIYLSNFLTGAVFWYGIEKLFMRNIGIDAVGVGVATAVFIIFNLIFDIPAGILADKWSRKGVLAVSALALGLSSLLLGLSHGLLLYCCGEIFYGIYVVSTSGTYAALTYDILHEQGRAEDYSKVAGRAFATFLAASGLIGIIGGFIAQHYGYRITFLMSIIPCALNALLLLSIREPKFHKPEQKEKVLRQLGQAVLAINKLKLLRVLTIVLTALAVSDLFKAEFGQLYMLRYVSAPQLLAILWSVYAFMWALGSVVAHHFRARLNTLIISSVVPFILMSFVDNWFSLVLFMFEVVAAAALTNQIETRIQENTPSEVRASILSVVATLGRAVAVPTTFILGWLFKDYHALVALRFVAVVSTAALIYWLWNKRGLPKTAEVC